jgi:hypothetical protein
MIDYYFANRHLKVGGLLAVDDINISSVRVLHKFLITEPAYEPIEINSLKTGLYRRIGETRTGCFDQRFNAKVPRLFISCSSHQAPREVSAFGT